MHNEELYHHGILGQKWGVRRYQNKDGSLTPAGQRKKTKANQKKMKKVRAAKVAKQKAAAKEAKKNPNSVKSLSDDELRKRIQRLQLEQQYNQLSPKHISAGQKFVNNFKDNMTRDMANVASTQIKNYINKQIEKKINPQVSKTTDLSKILSKEISSLSDKEVSDAVSRIAKEKVIKDYLKNK